MHHSSTLCCTGYRIEISFFRKQLNKANFVVLLPCYNVRPDAAAD